MPSTATPVGETRGRGQRARRLSSCLVLALACCSKPAAPKMPDPLRVGVMATERPNADYLPLVRHLAAMIGGRAELIRSDSYDEQAERFHRGEIDLAYFTGATFVAAEQRDGAVPLTMRIMDRHSTSVVIARTGLEGRFPDDFRGRSFVFGAKDKLSGNLMPRHLFNKMKLVPETFFGSVTSLPNHVAVITAVTEGRADAGVVNGQVLRRQIEAGTADPRQFRQVWESPPFSDNVWVVPARLPLELRNRLCDVFLALDAANPADDKILNQLGARAYVPATRADFREIREMATGKPEYSRP